MWLVGCPSHTPLSPNLNWNPFPLLPTDSLTHKIFYKNQFSLAYKTDERFIHNIVKCKNPSDKIKFIPSQLTTFNK